MSCQKMPLNGGCHGPKGLYATAVRNLKKVSQPLSFSSLFGDNLGTNK